MISDLSNFSSSASPARTTAYGQATRVVKANAGGESSPVAVVKSVCVCCGRPISLRIGRPAARIATGPQVRLTSEALRLVNGTGRVCLDDLFAPSARQSAKSRNAEVRRFSSL